MKKVIAVVYSGFMGNYIKYFLDLCEKNNIIVDFITNNKETIEYFSVRNIYFLDDEIKPKFIKSKINGEKQIKSLINVEDYDFVLTDTLGLSFAYNVFHNVTLAQRMNVSSNLLYKIIFFLGHYKRILLDKLYYRQCKKVVVVSSLMKNDYVKNCSFIPDDVIVAYPGAALATSSSDICCREYDKKSPFIIGLSANGFVTKGGYVLLNALKVLKKKAPYINFRARIIYPKHEKNIFLKLYLKFCGLEQQVELLPFQNGMENFYKSLHCFCCSSRFEAFGRVVTEAMSYKLPVVVSSEVGASDIINDGENGFVYKVDKNISENFADKLISIYNNYDDMKNVVQKASNDVKKYTWEKFAEDIFYGFYQDLRP